MVGSGVVSIFVYSEHDGDVLALGRGRDNDFFNTAAEVFSGVLGLCKAARRFDNDLGPDLFPGNKRRVLFGKYPERIASDVDSTVAGADIVFQIAHYRVVFQQMSERFCVRQVIYRYQVNVSVAQPCSDNRAPYSSKAVDP